MVTIDCLPQILGQPEMPYFEYCSIDIIFSVPVDLQANCLNRPLQTTTTKYAYGKVMNLWN